MWNKLAKPIKLLAPMAGYTDSVFRQICRDFGASVVMTELISADAIYFGLQTNQSSSDLPCPSETLCEGGIRGSSRLKAKFTKSKTYDLMKFNESERPLVVQLFGKDSEKFLLAAKFIQDELKADGIDINMGCAVRKVLKSGHGAALLQNESNACKIVETLSDNLNIPVSVKTRLGYDNIDQILTFGPKLIKAGAKAVIVHGRTAKAGFAGNAEWGNIYKLKGLIKNEAVIIGNGDIFKHSDIKDKINNLDGVAIGRTALGQPWIFSDKVLNLSEIVQLARKQAELSYKAKGEHGIIELRKHLIWYFKGLPNASDLRKLFVEVKSIKDVENILNKISS